MAPVKVARIADIPEGTGITVSVEGLSVAVFNITGQLYAIGNTCPHRGGPLGEGMCSDMIVTCPWHGWSYDVRSGQGVTNPHVRVPTYKVSTEGEDVFVSLE